MPPGGKVVGHAGDIAITQPMIDAVVDRIPQDQLAQIKAQGHYKDLLERVAVGQVLYHRALDQKVQDDPKVQAEIAMSARDAMVSGLLDKIGKDAVSDDAVKKEYDARAVRYKRPSVHAAHIVVRDLQKAQELKKQLNGGADFATLAAQNSIDPSTKDKGGDLGWFEKVRMIPQIADPAFAAKPGDLLGPIETRMGYHLVLVEGKRDSTPLDEVRDDIEQSLAEKSTNDYVSKIEKETQVTWEDASEGASPDQGDQGKSDADADVPAKSAPAAGDAAPTPPAPAPRSE